jgi:gamma-glutamylcyclotransferase (GGCT)/AIG2-like uncharacterized protein YtfP
MQEAREQSRAFCFWPTFRLKAEATCLVVGEPPVASSEPRGISYTVPVAELVFFYGTLMAGFDRRRRAGMDGRLTYLGRGSIHAWLFDLGLYPAATPASEGRVWGEVYEVAEPAEVLAALDEIEGYRPGHPDRSLYVRSEAAVTMPDGTERTAWVYFYNAPLGQAERITSGDYLEHVKVR